MAPRDPTDPAASSPAHEPAKGPDPHARASSPDALDAFEAPHKPSPFSLDNQVRPPTPVRRGRLFDPKLMPLVPPSVTSDPARQFHALLGLPPASVARPAAAAPRPGGNGPDLDALLNSLSPARAKVIRQVLTGDDTRLKRALIAFLEDARFSRLDFESQRRALAAFDLRAAPR